MSMDPAALLGPVLRVRNSAIRYEHIYLSRTVTAVRSGTLTFRCMGAGGGGQAPRSGASVFGGGNGGTVAIKTVSVTAGDRFVITIPAGGSGGVANSDAPAAGGTLTVTRGGTTLLSIPGGRVGTTLAGQPPAANEAPTGADWYVLGGLGGTPPANGSPTGGGGAMIVEGGTVAGRGGNAQYSGGGGALGNGGVLGNGGGGGGGAFTSAIGAVGGGGFLPQETSVLRLSTPFAVPPYYNGSTTIPGSNGPFGLSLIHI